MRVSSLCWSHVLTSLVSHQAYLASRDKVAVGLALAHHFLTIRVEGVIHDPLSGVLFVVGLPAQMAEALGDGFQSRPLRLVPERIVGIRAVHDLAQQDQRRIIRQVVLLENGLKKYDLTTDPALVLLDRKSTRLNSSHT